MLNSLRRLFRRGDTSRRSVANNPDLEVRSLLEDPDLRAAMGLDVPEVDNETDRSYDGDDQSDQATPDCAA